MTKQSLFTLLFGPLLLLSFSSQTYAGCDLVLVNNEPHETPLKTYGESGISLAHQWLAILDPDFQSRQVLPSVQKNAFFLKYLKDRNVDFAALEVDGKERWFGKYLLWALNRMDRSIQNPQQVMNNWLKRLTGEEWDEKKIAAVSLSNKAHWQKLLNEKFPVADEGIENLALDHPPFIQFIPTLSRNLYLYTSEFKPPVASKQEHHRYGLANVENPFWGQYNAEYSSVIGVELHSLFPETKTVQPHHSRFSETEINREWSAQFGLIFPFAASGSKEDIAQVLELKSKDLPQFFGGSIRKLARQLMKPQDFEALCNEYFERLRRRGELSPDSSSSADEMNAKLLQLYALMGAQQFSLWVGPSIPSRHILHPQFYKDRVLINKPKQ